MKTSSWTTIEPVFRSATRAGMFIVFSMLTFLSGAQAEGLPAKVAIIKADDVRSNTENWSRFFAVSQEKGVKVAAGIICVSLEKENPQYFAWLKKWQATGQVEFWNHGWDHKKWTTDDGKMIREFSGTGYEHQKKHFAQSQALMKKVLGASPIAFGTPFNAMDEDTVKVMNEDPDLRLFFCNPGQTVKGKLLATMRLRGEHDGVGKPNFEKFKAEYKNKLTFSAIQFHPNNFGAEHFEEYAKILDLLLADGWKFVLPREYVAMKGKLNE